MDFIEPNTHSFIVRVWLEEIEDTGLAKWRGYVTHVASGERRYVRNVSEIAAFIVAYLEKMGVKLKRWRRVRNCLRRLWLRLSRARLR